MFHDEGYTQANIQADHLCYQSSGRCLDQESLNETLVSALPEPVPVLEQPATVVLSPASARSTGSTSSTAARAAPRRDVFAILTASGYAAGGPVTQGNIQVR